MCDLRRSGPQVEIVNGQIVIRESSLVRSESSFSPLLWFMYLMLLTRRSMTTLLFINFLILTHMECMSTHRRCRLLGQLLTRSSRKSRRASTPPPPTPPSPPAHTPTHGASRRPRDSMRCADKVMRCDRHVSFSLLFVHVWL